jgi:hypothetical protein
VALAQPLTFNTLAGYAGGGSGDGSGSAARLYKPCGVAADGSGNLYVADTYNHTIRKITPTGKVTTLAGLAGVSGSVDAPGTDARFNQPGGVAVDTVGNVYVGDSGNHTIRMITPGGVVSTLAGSTGVSGSTDATGTNAQFFLPQGVAVDSTGNVYVADYGNHTIRIITPGGPVSTLAGSAGVSGSLDASGTSARFYQPEGVAVDGTGNVYVADTANGTIRKIASSGATTTLAGLAGSYGSANGAGTNAQFYEPVAVAVDKAGNVYVADYANHTIRKVTTSGVVNTLAGTAGSYGNADGTNSSARFWGPEGVAVDSLGRVYVADTGNGTIRRIGSTGATTTITTWAGSASTDSVDGTGNNARFYWPGGVAVAGAGQTYVADTENSTIRKLTAAGLASTLAGSAGNSGSGDGAGSSARFYGPQGIAVDWVGYIYVADSANSTIRKLTPAGGVSTLAGTAGISGSLDGTSEALFNQPQGLAVDLAGTVYVADTWNHTIRMITYAGVVSTVAGSAGNYGSADGTNSKARFYRPAGVAVDGSGNLYVSDSFNHTIRKITPAGPTWLVSTVAGLAGVWGKADGTNKAARFCRPQGIALDGSGNLYVVDAGNETLRKLTASGTNWVVSTVGGLAGASGNANGLGDAARFYSPAGVAIGSGGALYVADSGNNSLRLSTAITNAAPAIVNQPQSQAVDPGSNVTFSVIVNGGTPLAYQWRFNGTNIAEMTANSYTRNNAQAGDEGNYSVVITNAVGSVISADAALVLNVAPFIVAQPQGLTVGIGQGASFNVLAGGAAPLLYQWRLRGNDIPGATDSSLTIAPVQGSNQGPYSVAVVNFVGVALSSDALLSLLAVSAVGDNSFGQSDISPAVSGTIAVAAGAWHSLALRADGGVVAWGNGFNGQCDVPPELTNALAIAAGGYHSLAIRADGSVLAWGSNDYEQTNVPAGLNKVMAVAGGTWHSLALRADGTVAAWGDNSTTGQTNVPAGLTNVVAIAAGGNHSLALRANGTVAAWGENTDDGGAFVGQSTVPQGLSNVIGIAAGEYHSLAVRADGSVVAWGDNGQGQCAVPAGLSNVVAVAGGGAHSIALMSDGSVAAWGADWNGQCELPSGLGDVVGISAGEAHSLVLVGSTLPEPRLLSPSLKNGRFSALLQTLNRRHYALEYAVSLTANQWTGITTNAGSGGLEILADPAATAPQRFYRMRQW